MEQNAVEENRMLWKYYFESDKNDRRHMDGMHRLWIERGRWGITEQILRTQLRNIEKKRFLSNVEIGQILGTGRAENNVETFNEEGDEVDGNLEVEIEEG